MVFLARDKPWASHCRCYRGPETSIWHLGKQRERGQSDGDHWGAGENTGGMSYKNYSWTPFSLLVRFFIYPLFFLSVQVTEETSHILSTLGYMCSCRGIINVKGKGELKTYFVHTEMTRSLSQGTVMPWSHTSRTNKTWECGRRGDLSCSVTKTHLPEINSTVDRQLSRTFSFLFLPLKCRPGATTVLQHCIVVTRTLLQGLPSLSKGMPD